MKTIIHLLALATIGISTATAGNAIHIAADEDTGKLIAPQNLTLDWNLLPGAESITEPGLNTARLLSSLRITGLGEGDLEINEGCFRALSPTNSTQARLHYTGFYAYDEDTQSEASISPTGIFTNGTPYQITSDSGITLTPGPALLRLNGTTTINGGLTISGTTTITGTTTINANLTINGTLTHGRNPKAVFLLHNVRGDFVFKRFSQPGYAGADFIYHSAEPYYYNKPEAVYFTDSSSYDPRKLKKQAFTSSITEQMQGYPSSPGKTGGVLLILPIEKIAEAQTRHFAYSTGETDTKGRLIWHIARPEIAPEPLPPTIN